MFESLMMKMKMIISSCFSEYGAPEEGELKKPEPFALKNQLLSKSHLFLLSAL